MKKMGIAVLSALVVAVVAFPQQALYDVVIHDGMNRRWHGQSMVSGGHWNRRR